MTLNVPSHDEWENDAKRRRLRSNSITELQKHWLVKEFDLLGDSGAPSSAQEQKVDPLSSRLKGQTMDMGFYKINLGTRRGRKIHAIHLGILIMIPLCILFVENSLWYDSNKASIVNFNVIMEHVETAIDLEKITQKLQDERIAINIQYIFETHEELDTIEDLEKFQLKNTFIATDMAISDSKKYPQLENFTSKSSFGKKITLLRENITKKEFNNESFVEVLEWYNSVTDEFINYINFNSIVTDTTSINFWLIGYKNILTSQEFSVKTLIYRLQSLISSQSLPFDKREKFIEYDALRSEYLDQALQILPDIADDYSLLKMANDYEKKQKSIIEKNEIKRSVNYTIEFLIQYLQHVDKLRETLKNIGQKICHILNENIEVVENDSTILRSMIWTAVILLPISLLLIFNLSRHMMRY